MNEELANYSVDSPNLTNFLFLQIKFYLNTSYLFTSTLSKGASVHSSYAGYLKKALSGPQSPNYVLSYPLLEKLANMFLLPYRKIEQHLVHSR